MFQTTRSFTFEANRHPLVQEIEDKIDQGVRKTRITFTRDGRGRILTRDTDNKRDGTIDFQMNCVYDDPARLRVCTTTQPGQMGTVTSRDTRLLRSDGQLESRVRLNAAGETTSQLVYTYDAQGRWLTYSEQLL